MHIRAMSETDLDAVFCIETASYPSPWSQRIFKDCFASKYYCSVLEEEGDIFGYLIAMLVVDEVSILNICVSANARRKGSARLLLNSLFQHARECSAEKAYLEVRESNVPALNLYRSIGFYQAGIRESYYPSEGGREDALVMTLDLKN